MGNLTYSVGYSALGRGGVGCQAVGRCIGGQWARESPPCGQRGSDSYGLDGDIFLASQPRRRSERTSICSDGVIYRTAQLGSSTRLDPSLIHYAQRQQVGRRCFSGHPRPCGRSCRVRWTREVSGRAAMLPLGRRLRKGQRLLCRFLGGQVPGRQTPRRALQRHRLSLLWATANFCTMTLAITAVLWQAG